MSPPHLSHGARIALGLLVAALALLWLLPRSQTPADGSSARTAPASSPRAIDPDQRTLRDSALWLAGFSAAAADSNWPVTPADRVAAKTRRAAMEHLMRTDPRAALQQAVSLDVWHHLPAELQADIEEPFSAVADFDVFPVCPANPADHTADSPTVIRSLRVAGREPLETYVFGRRLGLTSKSGTPVQGIRLGQLAALREEVFQPLAARELKIAKRLFALANPLGDRDFSTGAALGSMPVAAIAGGKIFKFADSASLTAFDSAIASLDDAPGPKSGASVLFLPYLADAQSTSFDLQAATTLTTQLASSWTETKKKLYILRCDFSDKTDASFPALPSATYATLLNTQVSDNIKTFSYGKTWIEATVSPTVVRMPRTAAYYAAAVGGTSSNNLLLSDAKAAFLALPANVGFSFTNFDIVGVSFPSIGMQIGGLTYAGLAQQGGADLWLQGTSDASIHIHELGHNYGLGHSSFWKPSNTDPVDPFGTSDEYGDPFDIMGGGVGDNSPHAEAKQRLNWLATGEWTDATAAGSANHRIYRIDHLLSSGVRGIRLTKAANEYYWLTYRRQFPNEWLRAGANIVWQRAFQNRSWLIDTTPGSLAGTSDRTDGSLPIGRTYSNGTTHVTALARGGAAPNEHLDVRVNIGSFLGNVAPSANLTGPDTIGARQTCVFSVQAADADNDPLAYSWDFGQGFTFDNNPTASFAWNSGGTFTVKVSVSDMKGHTTVATMEVTVSDPINSWSDRTPSSSIGNFTTVIASPTKVLAAGERQSGGAGPVATSADGTTWVSYTLANNQHMFGGVWDGTQFVLAGMDYTGSAFVGCILTSTTGNSGSWTRQVFTGSILRAMATGAGVRIAVGDNGTIRRSTNGTSWTAITSGTTNHLYGVSYGGGRFLAVGFDPVGYGKCCVLSSSDGLTWSNISATAVAELLSWHDFRSIAWLNNRFVASGWYSKLRTSTDLGASFTTTRSDTEEISAFAFGNGVYFAAGINKSNSDASIDLISTDGSNWTTLTTPSVANRRRAAIFFNNTFITAGDFATIRQSGAILPSTNGYITWRDSYFPDRGTLTTTTADGDSDGLKNFFEYALATSPASGAEGLAAAPQASTSTNPLLTGRICTRFTLPEPAQADVRYIVEVSDLLGTWTPLASKIGTGSWTWNPGGTSRVVLGAPAAGKVLVTVGDSQLISVASKRFLRLRCVVNQ